MSPNIVRILCVDDERYNLELLEAILAPRGYEVLLADNGRCALRKIRKEKVDLVLLDVMMPGMNGYDVCRAIKGDERCRGIPVILVTALSSPDDRVHGIEAGAEDYISKPITREDVFARIRMALKVKSLNDRLESAHRKIKDLTRRGEEIEAAFDPDQIDLFPRRGDP